MPTVKRIHHVAMLVDDLDQALGFWHQALGIELDHIAEVPEQKSQVAFLPAGESEIELVRPTTDDSGVAKYLAKRGPGMHHLCVEVDDLPGMLAQLEAQGVRLINEFPMTTADGRQYAFVHPESTSGVLVELYQL